MKCEAASRRPWHLPVLPGSKGMTGLAIPNDPARRHRKMCFLSIAYGTWAPVAQRRGFDEMPPGFDKRGDIIDPPER